MARRKRRTWSKAQRTSKWLTPERRAAIYLRDEFRCVYCERDPRSSADYHAHFVAEAPPIAAGLTLDHVVPRGKPGGTHASSNVVTACERCNEGKGEFSVEEWLAGAPPRQRRFLAGVLERISTQTKKPVDLEAGKAFVGARAARPLTAPRPRPSASTASVPF